MKIARVEVFALKASEPERPHWTSHFIVPTANEILVRLYTDEGPAGCIVEAFTDPERDPLQAELFEDPPKISNGRLHLKEAPGLGLELSERALRKFGRRLI